MNSDSINRELLIKFVNLVRPALATTDYIAALKHILFADGFATAYNDIAAIQVRVGADLDLGVCLPGDMLLKTLNSFNAESVAMMKTGEQMVISSGRSKIKMATLPAKTFPIEIPDGEAAATLVFNGSILQGIQRCLISVGNDPTHPATMGVTIEADDGVAVLYSTDNTTISRYQTKAKMKLPGGSPVILPVFFCEQLLTLAKSLPGSEAFPGGAVEVELHPGALVAYFFDKSDKVIAKLFQKTLVDTEPLDFPGVIERHIDVTQVKDRVGLIPNPLDSALQRALLILGSELDRATEFTVTDSAIKMLTTSPNGEASDSIAFEGGQSPQDAFNVDPAMLSRACKTCTHMGFFKRVVAMTDDNFLHLIAHCAV